MCLMMNTPIGSIPVREHIARELSGMTDLEVALKTFGEDGSKQRLGSYIDPEAFAELERRALVWPGDTDTSVIARITGEKIEPGKSPFELAIEDFVNSQKSMNI